MHIDIISVIPELLDSPLSHSIMKRAKEKGLLTVEVASSKKVGCKQIWAGRRLSIWRWRRNGNDA